LFERRQVAGATPNPFLNNQVGRWPDDRRAMLGREARRNAPRRKEVGAQEHAAGQVRHPQDIG
jgi:hypothetical protein